MLRGSYLITAFRCRFDRPLCAFQKQLEEAQKFIDDEMGKLAKQRAFEDAPLNLTKEEKDLAAKRFNKLDKDRKGYITINDLRRYFRVSFDNKSYLRGC